MDPILLTGYMLLIGSFVLFTISLFVEPNGFATLSTATPMLWIAFFLSGVLATGVGQPSITTRLAKSEQRKPLSF